MDDSERERFDFAESSYLPVKISGIVIIGGDAELTENICSRLRKPGIYLTVIEAPMVRMEKYGIFEGDCVRVVNMVCAIQPTLILFTKVESKVSDQLYPRLRDYSILAMEAFDEEKLSTSLSLGRAIGSSDFVAKKSQDFLAHLYVVEGPFGFSHIIAANLAVAHGGRIVEIAAVTDADIDTHRDDFRIWSNGTFDERMQAKDDIIRFMKMRLPEELFGSPGPESISFITRGVPYGLLPFRCPTSHYYSFPLLGISVVSGMLKHQSLVRCPIALLIDPNLVGKSEFNLVSDKLGQAGYILRLAYDKNATINVATYLGQYLPCDLIFFSTHCGELDGHRIVERFSTDDGTIHEFHYDRALSLAAVPGSELFEVIELSVPIAMDGVSWGDKVGKARINAGDLMEVFFKRKKEKKAEKEKADYVSVKPSKRIKGFEALQMSDGNYFPLPRQVGGFHYPVVFNNTCGSWRSASIAFGAGGASVYIGTATDVLNPVAVSVASEFVKEVTSGKCIGVALSRAQRQFIDQFGYSPYLMHGYIFTKLVNPTPRLRGGHVLRKIAAGIAAIKRLPEQSKISGAITVLEGELANLRRCLTKT